jgi:anti-sigma B factor antagonist
MSTPSATERPPFGLTTSERNGCRIFHMTGRLMDQQQADHLMEVLDKELGTTPGMNTILDCSQLQYMNSTGLNIVISVMTRTKQNGGEVLLAGLTSAVRQLFAVTKLDTVFKITGSVDEALAVMPK